MFGIDDALLGGLIGGGMNLIGGLFQNSANAASADKQMKFQERMSSTAYQRAMADMKKAGLNPMLAYQQGGASSAAGASYSATNVGASAVEGASAGANSARASMLMKSQIENMTADTALKADQGTAAKAAAVASLSNAELAKNNSALVAGQMPYLISKAGADAMSAMALTGEAEGRGNAGNTEAKYLTSNLGAMLRMFALGGKDVATGLSGIGDALPLGKWLNQLIKGRA